ncbi:hypothetical protein ABBQ38_003665 [Trebouxia sp. C0009 RCD-2024]
MLGGAGVDERALPPEAGGTDGVPGGDVGVPSSAELASRAAGVVVLPAAVLGVPEEEDPGVTAAVPGVPEEEDPEVPAAVPGAPGAADGFCEEESVDSADEPGDDPADDPGDDPGDAINLAAAADAATAAGLPDPATYQQERLSTTWSGTQ